MILYRAISSDGCVTPGHVDVDPLLRNVAAAGLVAALPFAECHDLDLHLDLDLDLDLDRDLEVVHHHGVVVINQPRANH